MQLRRNARRRLDAVDVPFYMDVHEHDIGLEIPNVLQGLLAGRGHRGHLITQPRQLLAQVQRDDALILDYQNFCCGHVAQFFSSGKRKSESCGVGPSNVHRAAELIGEHGDELQSQCGGLRKIQTLRNSDTVVGDGQQHHRGGFGCQIDRDLAFTIAGKSVLQRVRDELVDHEAARDRRVDRQQHVDRLDRELNAIGANAVRRDQCRHERIEKIAEVYAREVFRFVERLVDQRHRPDAILALAHHPDHDVIFDARRLQAEQAVHDLQVVLDAMVNFAEQHVFLSSARRECFVLCACGRRYPRWPKGPSALRPFRSGSSRFRSGTHCRLSSIRIGLGRLPSGVALGRRRTIHASPGDGCENALGRASRSA